MNKVTNEWQRCFKTKPAFVRLVRGEKERVDTREGITYAYAETDFVMCGCDESGLPRESDMYPIKHNTFSDSYRLDVEPEMNEPELVCRRTGNFAKLQISVNRIFLTSNVHTPQIIEDYELNPQHGQTFLTVIGDESDQMGSWMTQEIKCTSCGECMSPSAALSHLMTEEEYSVYQSTVGENC